MNDYGDFVVRILKARLENFQNVERGEIEFVCNTKENMFKSGSDILGIYGQNGSGKTAFLRSLSTLCALLSGKRIPKEVKNYISIGKDTAALYFEFGITDHENTYRVFYEAHIKQRSKEEMEFYEDYIHGVVLEREKLSYKVFQNGTWKNQQTLIETAFRDSQVFKPKAKFSELIAQNQNYADELRIAKKYAEKQSTSFIFSNDMIRHFLRSDTNLNQDYKNIIGALSFFGKYNLLVIDNKNSGLITSNIGLPLNFKNAEGNAMASIRINLNDSTVIPKRVYSVASKVIDTTNIVLKEIIPELTISLKNLGEHLLDDRETGVIVELVANRNGKSIPLKYESEGIIKIISILHLLINMYNSPSTTLAIDEIDSGVFEYLLGEILKIVEDSGKGQLIFTSHNLRPLETINRKSIMFTTTNPLNRYTRMANVKTNHNLRDFYYHDIILGGQKETLYEETNSYAISHAFRLAGEVDE